jgi:hypothetical protein
MSKEQVIIQVRNTPSNTNPFLRRAPQPWIFGFERVRFNCIWYELQKDEKGYFIDFKKRLGQTAD